MIMPKITQKNRHNSSVSAVYAHFTAQLTIMPIPYSVILQKRICMRIIRCRSLMHFYFTDKSVFLILSLIRRISILPYVRYPQPFLTSEGLLHGVNHKYYPVSDSACRLQVYIVSDRLSRSKRNQPLSLKDH